MNETDVRELRINKYLKDFEECTKCVKRKNIFLRIYPTYNHHFM